jgi:hypothetical protein
MEYGITTDENTIQIVVYRQRNMSTADGSAGVSIFDGESSPFLPHQ